MDRLIAMDYLMQAARTMHYERQGQVTLSDVREVTTLLNKTSEIAKTIPSLAPLSVALIQASLVCETFGQMNKDVMPNSIKETLEGSMSECLAALALNIREHYNRNHFDLNKEIHKIMRFVVEINVKRGII